MLSGPWRGQGRGARGESREDPRESSMSQIPSEIPAISFPSHNPTHLSSQIAELQCVRAEQSPMRLLPRPFANRQANPAPGGPELSKLLAKAFRGSAELILVALYSPCKRCACVAASKSSHSNNQMETPFPY